MPYDDCAPLPKWARILKDKKLFYFVPSFPEILVQELEDWRHNNPEMALAYALYRAQPDAGTLDVIEENVVKLKKAFKDRNLNQLTYIAHLIVSQTSMNHRRKMQRELNQLKLLHPYQNLYAL